VGVAAVGGEDDGAENVGFVLDGEDARRGVVVIIVQASQPHGDDAVIGFPIGQQRPSLVPEVADIDRAECVIGVEVSRADDVLLFGRVFRERLDLQSRFWQIGEVVKELVGTFGAEAMGIEALECFALGHEIQPALRGPLDEGERAVTQQRRVASAVRAGPLAGRCVEVPGDVAPGEAVEFVQELA